MCQPHLDKHLPIRFRNTKFDIILEDNNIKISNIEENISKQHYHCVYFEIEEKEKMENILVNTLYDLKKEFNLQGVKAIEWYRVINVCPSYSEKPRIKTAHKGLMGRIDSAGNIQTLIVLT